MLIMLYINKNNHTTLNLLCQSKKEIDRSAVYEPQGWFYPFPVPPDSWHCCLNAAACPQQLTRIKRCNCNHTLCFTVVAPKQIY